MSSIFNNPQYNISYENTLDVHDNISTKSIAAYKDLSNNAKNLTLGASSNVVLEAYNGINMTVNSNSGVKLYNYNINNGIRSDIEILKISNDTTQTTIQSSNLPLTIAGGDSNQTTTVSILTFQNSNNSQVISTINSNINFQKPIVLSSNMDIQGNSYTSTFNVKKDVIPTIYNNFLNQVAYSFYINDYNQLQIVQFNRYGINSNFSSDVKLLNVFGTMESIANKYIAAASNYKILSNYDFQYGKTVPLQNLDSPFFTFSTFTFSSLNNSNFSSTGDSYLSYQSNATYNNQEWFNNYFSMHNNFNGYQKWVVPKTGNYLITAAGARGGTCLPLRSGLGGFGGLISGTFTLSKGSYLIMICGQFGQGQSVDQTGGGGGSYVISYDGNNYNPLIVAGGGGGAHKTTNGCNAVTLSPSNSIAQSGTALGQGGSNVGLGYNSFLTNNLNGCTGAFQGGFGGGGAGANVEYGAGGGGYIGGNTGAGSNSPGFGGTNYIGSCISPGILSSNLNSNGYITVNYYNTDIPLAEYPPVGLTNNTSIISGQPYGNGTYTITASTYFSLSYYQYFLFNKDINTGWSTQLGLYNNVTGDYFGGNSISGILGEWFAISLPVSIILTKYTILPRLNTIYRAPKNFKILGSTDGSNWSVIDTRSNITSWANNVETSFTFSNNTSYRNYALSVTKIIGNSNIVTDQMSVNFNEFKLFA